MPVRKKHDRGGEVKEEGKEEEKKNKEKGNEEENTDKFMLEKQNCDKESKYFVTYSQINSSCNAYSCYCNSYR